jgi:hypothetical protein
MKLVELHIARRQAEFTKHPFFAKVGEKPAAREMRSFAPDLTFWVMAFQDILRLNARLTADVQMRRIVRHHLAEDAGHDRWFLDDLAALQVPQPDVASLFSKQHRPTRDAAYALMSEVFRVSDDRLRVILIKTLESAGHVFFERVSSKDPDGDDLAQLKYFSLSHLEVERSHEVFEREMAETISSIQLPSSLRSQAMELVDRCYVAFGSMFDALCPAQERAGDGLAAYVPARKAVVGRQS